MDGYDNKTISGDVMFYTAGYFPGLTNQSVPYWLSMGLTPEPLTFTYWCHGYNPRLRDLSHQAIAMDWGNGLCWKPADQLSKQMYICETETN